MTAEKLMNLQLINSDRHTAFELGVNIRLRPYVSRISLCKYKQ